MTTSEPTASAPPADSARVARALLQDAFGRVHESLPGLLDGLGADALGWRADADANPIGWLVWHLSRVQDDHVAGVGGVEQAWSGGWESRFGLPYAGGAIGYGQTSADVAVFSVSAPALLLGYHDAVHALTIAVLDGMEASDYDRVVDRRWTPPVTAAVRLVSVVNDITQHLGQAAYVRGLWERRQGSRN
jgi:hypothetical protein